MKWEWNILRRVRSVYIKKQPRHTFGGVYPQASYDILPFNDRTDVNRSKAKALQVKASSIYGGC